MTQRKPPAETTPAETTPAIGDDAPKLAAGVESSWQVGDFILETYDVLERYDGGAMGEVYRVRHRGWRMDLAVKTPRHSVISTLGLAQFVREAQTWVDLGLHPHIVSCYYVRVLGGVPRVFAEFVDGGSLRDWIESGQLYADGPELALRRMLDIAIQFAWGLAFAHERGLIHQDVKPANVLLTRDGIAKVSDFGLAAASESGGHTPAYCSPEQAAKRPLTVASDVWSWGVSLLEMWSGGLTWRSGIAAPHVLASIASDGHPNIPSMPSALVALLRRCFAGEPAARPQRMTELVAELRAMHGEPYPRAAPEAAKLAADSLNNRGVSLLDLDDPQGALEAFRAALASDPTHVAANINLGQTSWEHWDCVAIPFTFANRGFDPSAPETFGARRHPSDVDIARYFDTAVERVDTRALVARAAFRLRIGDATGALADAEQAGAAAARQRASAYVELGRAGEAIALLEGDDDPMSQRTLARARLADGADLATVVAPLRLACRLAPNDAHAWVDLGSILELADDEAGASSAFDRALALQPRCPYALLRAGRHVLAKGQRDQARSLFERASQSCPGLTDDLVRELGGTVQTPQLQAGDAVAWPRLHGPCANDDAWLLAPVRLGPRPVVKHPGSVLGLAAWSGGRFVASCSQGRLSLWDLELGLEAHAYDLGAVAIACVSPTAIVVGMKNPVLIDFTGDVTELEPPPAGDTNLGDFVSAVAVDGSGRRAASCTLGDMKVKIWSLAPPRLEQVIGKGLRDGFGLDGANHVAFSPDGNILYAVGHDTRLHVFDVEAGRAVADLRAHAAEVTSVAASPSGSYVLTTSKDRTVKLWNVGPYWDRVLSGHGGMVVGAAFLDDRRAVSVSSDGTLRVWDLARGRVLAIVSDLDFRYTGVVGTSQAIVTGARDGWLRVAPLRWQSELPLPLRFDLESPIIERPASALEVGAAGAEVDRLLASAGPSEPSITLAALRRAQALPGHGRDERVLGRLAALGLSRVRIGDAWRRVELRPGETVFGVAFSPDGCLALVGIDRGSAHVYEVPSGQLRHSSPAHTGEGWGVVWRSNASYLHTSNPWIHEAALASSRVIDWKLAVGDPGDLVALVASRDGSRIFAGACDRSGTVLFRVTGDPARTLGGVTLHDAPLSAVAISPDGDRLLVSARDGWLAICDVTGNEPRVIRTLSHPGVARAMAFVSPSVAVIGDATGIPRTWNVMTDRLVSAHDGCGAEIRAIAVAPDRRFAAICAGREVVVLDLETGQQRRVGTHDDVALAVDFSPDQRYVLSGGDRRAVVWEIDWRYVGEDVHVANLDKAALTTPVAVHRELDPVGAAKPPTRLHPGAVVAIAPGGTRRAWTDDVDIVFGDGRVIQTAHLSEIRTLAWHPDEPMLASGGDDGTANLWNADTGEKLREIAWRGDSVRCVQFTPDGALAMAGDGGRVKITLVDGRTMDIETGDARPMEAVAVSADGLVAAAGISGIVHVFGRTSGARVATLTGHSGPVRALAFVCGRLVSAGEDGTLRVWDARNGRALHTTAPGPSLRRLFSHANIALVLAAGLGERVLALQTSDIREIVLSASAPVTGGVIIPALDRIVLVDGMGNDCRFRLGSLLQGGNA